MTNINNTETRVEIDYNNSFIEIREQNKSILHIGNCHIYNEKKFNKLNKFMFKFFFGIEIEDIRSN